MRLNTEPRKPSWSELTRVPIQGRLYPEWEPFLNPLDASYWNTEAFKGIKNPQTMLASFGDNS